ncbi:MAG: secretin N-terminal domain-containing protein [Terrimicrobiaceae bacterium]|nr:secretin N-terminal domain-containing protein [Terrimicrobiaceae bacterium]
MAIRLSALLLLLLAASVPLRAQAAPDDRVSIQFPSNQVNEVATFYELLTGKHVIRDSGLAGQMISLVVQQPVTKKEAAALIESVLVLNGFTLVNVDDKTAKLLGPSKFPRSEAVPLYSDPSQLPNGDEIVSYFMPFRYIKSEEANNVFLLYAPNRQFGSYAQVPSVNAIVITETAAVVRRLIALKNAIDVQGARTATEFFPLERADAEKVVEILSKLFEKSDDNPASRAVPANNTIPNPGNAPVVPPGGAAQITGPAQKVQVFADKRTNRVMVVAPEAQMPYIRTLIQGLDVGVEFDEVLERPLRFVRAADVLPVLANLLVEGPDQNGQAQAPKIAGEGDNNAPGSPNSNPGYSNSDNSGGSSGGGGGSGGGLSLNEKTSFTAESTKPLSMIVGNSRIIADRSVNKILVIGPPEARNKASRVLDLLDQRPKQVYLACVIGQLTLTNNTEFGIDYLLKFGSVRILGQGTTAGIANLLANRNASINTPAAVAATAATAAATAATTAASTALPVLSGLTVFGAIADGVDIVARALGATGRFQVISRPVIYTANGQGALISSGQEVPVPVSTQSSIVDTTGNVNNNNTGTSLNTQIDYKRVVLQLDVRPLINSDHEVTLEIKQRNDNVQSQVQVANNSVPVIATQTLNTTVTVPNRQTIVLGGLISDQEERNQTGIPFLKDIPGLGYLFSTTTKTKTRRELIIMIQPFIINSDDSLKQVNYIERANTNFREHMFDEPVPVKPATLPAPEDLTDPKLR